MKSPLLLAATLCIAPLFVPAASAAVAAGIATATTASTFECVSVYYPNGDAATCQVHYRAAGGGGEWRPAFDLWYDARNQEHRGSIVGLTPDTDYEIRLTHAQKQTLLNARTRSDRFPIGRTTHVSSQPTALEIKESGTPDGAPSSTSRRRPRPAVRCTFFATSSAARGARITIRSAAR